MSSPSRYGSLMRLASRSIRQEPLAVAMLRRWLDSWRGQGDVRQGVERAGPRPRATPVPRRAGGPISTRPGPRTRSWWRPPGSPCRGGRCSGRGGWH
jgi:hypothetical protein